MVLPCGHKCVSEVYFIKKAILSCQAADEKDEKKDPLAMGDLSVKFMTKAFFLRIFAWIENKKFINH